MLEIIGTMQNACMYQRPKNPKPHDPLPVGSIEKGWLNYTPFFKGEVKEHELTPVGTAPTLEGLGHFLNRVEEIQAIQRTQHMELPTVQQELAQTGIGSFTLSSSGATNEDDDSAELSEEELNKLACRYGTGYMTYDLAPIMQRIEWEKSILASSVPIKVKLIVSTGKVSVRSESKDKQLIATLAKKLFIATGKPDAAAVKDMRAFEEHYGVVGSTLRGKPTGAQWPEQSMDILGAEDMMPEDEVSQGPQELGLHWLTSDDPEHYAVQYMVLPEPHENDLWPLEEAV